MFLFSNTALASVVALGLSAAGERFLSGVLGDEPEIGLTGVCGLVLAAEAVAEGAPTS